MDALRTNKFINVKMFHPKFLSNKHYYFTIDWGIATNIKDKTVHRTLILNVHHINDELIAEFTFVRCNRHHHFTLFSFGLNNRYYTKNQDRYFDLYLALDPDFVLVLKERYYEQIEAKRKNKH